MGVTEFDDENFPLEDLIDSEFITPLTEDVAQGPGGEDGPKLILKRRRGILLTFPFCRLTQVSCDSPRDAP